MSLYRPATLSDALHRLGQAPAALVAGGTDLYPALRDAAPPSAMIDLTGIADLAGIARDDGGWRIGAATTWTGIVRAALPPLFDGLKAAAREVGSLQIQNAGTVAGNLCNASPAADGMPPLLALDAEVEIAGAAGTRRMALRDFVTGVRQTALAPGEIVTAIRVPDRPGRSAFLKLGARRYLVISIAMVAARVELDAEGKLAEVAVAVGACSSVARRLPELERRLVGRRADEIAGIVAAAPLDGLAPIDDIRATAAYRVDAARTLVARALLQAAILA
ncbi:N-methylhydantoinase B [Palleronia aestuarii]|uniref:N-methylhydantoinase B n=1 Tax=Palleronia aestuarii TaxID=568105 RepID=A0A2W7NAC2_9RHOB|nr:FAD binding domain-containing protein [Palleronia aestuarii]PZX17028.1 N-methylhydantoinase B [Palleronia aestuarii]